MRRSALLVPGPPSGQLARMPGVGWSTRMLLALQVQMRAAFDLPTPSSGAPSPALGALPTASPPPATVGGKLGVRIFNTAADAAITVCRMAEQADAGAACHMVRLPGRRVREQACRVRTACLPLRRGGAAGALGPDAGGAELDGLLQRGRPSIQRSAGQRNAGHHAGRQRGCAGPGIPGQPEHHARRHRPVSGACSRQPALTWASHHMRQPCLHPLPHDSPAG